MPTAERIRQWCHGSWIGQESEASITELAIDTRRINEATTAAFVALRTERRDGHSFIASAYEEGVRLFIVSKGLDPDKYPGAFFIQVPDTLIALQAIAAGHRASFSYPVIGITGSNGKTIIKEWLYSTLSVDRKVVRSPRSFNSQIGVPLSVWLMSESDQLGVFEAGISRPNEMAALEQIIRPNIGIFTNIREAHSEGFESLQQKANEKVLLFRNAKTIIYCSDYEEVDMAIRQQLSSSASEVDLFSWSVEQEARLRITERNVENGHTSIKALYQSRSIGIRIPFNDAASIENAIHVWCTLLQLGLSDQQISERLAGLQAVEMRMQAHRGTEGCTIINDTYSSDLTSLSISLDFLESQRKHTRRTVILSDMLQMGKPDEVLYTEVAAMIARRDVSRFIGIGPAIWAHKAAFRAHRDLHSIFFKSTAAFLKSYYKLKFEDEAILLKGARPFAFEQIDALLQEEVHQTVLSINLSTLNHNLAAFRSHIGPEVKLMAMVKAFSYGAGSHEIASALQYAGVDYLTVAYTDEGIALRKAGITLPIMVMSPEATAFDRMIAWKLEPEIFNLRSLESFTRIAETLGVKHYPIHIKLDTGMHRLGFTQTELEGLISILGQHPELRVASIFSHLAASENAAMDAFTAQQAAVFSQASETLINALGYTPFRHLCNTAGILRHPHLHFDMVRLGLGLYGIDGTGVLSKELQQIGTLRTTIAQIKQLPAGEGIGYGHSDAAERDRRIATISIGYADGYPRALGHGRAHVLIHGKPAPLVGVVCMDMCMVDITAIPEAEEGDEVIVFGPQLPLRQLAEWGGTIPYEMMTGISQRVKRVYVAE